MTRKTPDFLKAASFTEPNILSWTAYVWYFDTLILSLADVSV